MKGNEKSYSKIEVGALCSPTGAYIGVSSGVYWGITIPFFCGHVIYQMKANEKSSSKIEVGALCPPPQGCIWGF